ncbi:AsnC family transcriptional regulator [Halobacterium zhouii]|uniref:AsnC family transcriptional regulator n=1 Tax=Halobacterium zhouii TaxID=2902624 RepID=UPI001E38A5E5|nr:AsnC family transcriptional regulator [Halobacterium zhouii]
MAELDETDRRILELLAADARRPYSDIADDVGLSAPAVSERVSKLRGSGIINRFTVDVDHSALRGGSQVLVTLSPTPGDEDAVRESVSAADAVEHVFVTASGDVVCVANVPVENVRSWVTDVVDRDVLGSYDVEVLAESAWNPSVGNDIALACAECGNTVTNEGETAEVGGERHHFCCSSCRARFEERYERHESAA